MRDGALRSLNAALFISTMAAALFGAVPATAAIILLDFDSAATGSNIIITPLVTSAGTITAVNAELVNFTSDAEFNAAGASGNKIDHLGSPSQASLLFDFDVAEITLIYGGNLGDITIQARDSSGSIVDSFFQADTDGGQPAGPITLSGVVGIRSLTWFETNGSFAGLDNVAITSVPEPITLMLVATALAGLGFSRRKRIAN